MYSLTERENSAKVRWLYPNRQSTEPLRVSVADNTYSTLVMRDDTDYAVEVLARHLGVTKPEHCQLLAQAYQKFLEDLRRALYQAVAQPDGLEFHLIDATYLTLAVHSRIHRQKVISLDPLIDRIDKSVEFARGFLIGGAIPVGTVPRPNSASISCQLSSIRRSLANNECTLVEDDVYTGRSLAQTISWLRDAHVNVTQVVTGIQVSSSVPVVDVPLSPVIEYEVPAPFNSTTINFLDPRNFLFGVSGLVVKLEGYGWGRAPYWLPFVDIVARAGLSRCFEKGFALDMLRCNIRFFELVQLITTKTVCVGDLPLPTRQILQILNLATPTMSVLAVLKELKYNLDYYTNLVRRAELRQQCGKGGR